MAKGIVVVAKPSLFPAGVKTMLALPHLLRLVRSGLVDNGFVGIRAVLQMKQFQQALMAQEQPQDGGEKPAPVAFEVPDFMPEETEAKQSSATTEHFANLVEGEYTLVSEKGTAKYLVCNPTHKWIVAQHDDLIYLCSCSMKTVALLAKSKEQIIPTNFFSLI